LKGIEKYGIGHFREIREEFLPDWVSADKYLFQTPCICITCKVFLNVDGPRPAHKVNALDGQTIINKINELASLFG
jgi:hypothetical protein